MNDSLAPQANEAYAMDGAAQLIDRINRLCRDIVCGRKASQELKQLAATVGLSEAEFRLLWLLGYAPSQDQRALADRLAVSSALVSGSVERLRQRQLITGVRNSDDRRCQQWQLTANGRELLGHAVKADAAENNVVAEVIKEAA